MVWQRNVGSQWVGALCWVGFGSFSIPESPNMLRLSSQPHAPLLQHHDPPDMAASLFQSTLSQT